MAATSPELRGTSVFEHLMVVALVIVVMLALYEPASATSLNLLSRVPLSGDRLQTLGKVCRAGLSQGGSKAREI